jgi:hypothetical protein
MVLRSSTNIIPDPILHPGTVIVLMLQRGVRNNAVFVTALNAVTGQLVDEPWAPAVSGPGGPWNCKYLHQPA